MNRFYVLIAVVASMFLVACASQTNQAAGGPDRTKRVTATGYTEGGCLLNLKLAAREKNARLLPDDVQVKSNFFLSLFPFLNQEGYHCSGSFIEREKRPSGRDPLYPID